SYIITWFGNCTTFDRKTLQRIVRTAEKIIEVSLPSITNIYLTRCIRKATNIVKDPTNPSHELFTLLPSGRSPSGQAKPYSLVLGRRIKQRLWEALFCPTLREEVKPDGQFHVTESFSTPTFNSFVPHFEVEMSGEPTPEQPKKKSQRH
ncbi:hypothetical protein P4O66_004636, partial [Electrophorus voltai]